MRPTDQLDQLVRETYKWDYKNLVNSGGPLGRWIYRRSHLDLERGLELNHKLSKVLELGAQEDQHRAFVSHEYSNYILSDIDIAPLVAKLGLQNGKAEGSVISDKIEIRQIDAHKIPFPDAFFDRIVATCLVSHLMDPINALSEWRRVVKVGGIIDFYVPCEPSFALRLARKFTRKRVNRRIDVSLDLIQYFQHKTHFLAIHEYVNYIFKEDSIKFKKFPFDALPFDFNLYAIYRIRKN